jgi:hypothetical protein
MSALTPFSAMLYDTWFRRLAGPPCSNVNCFGDLKKCMFLLCSCLATYIVPRFNLEHGGAQPSSNRILACKYLRSYICKVGTFTYVSTESE